MWWALVGCAVLGYAVGSIPVGLIVGRVARGIDIRQFGSGKIGFTNVLRTVGVRWGIVALVGDLAKGVVPVLVARWVSDEPYVMAVAGLGSAIGHDWPVFAGFKGGRGVATSFGAALVMNPIAAGVLVPFGIGLVAVTRIVSVMSVGMAPVLAVEFIALSATGRQPWAFAIYATIAATIVVVLHRENIQRLLDGTEPQIGRGGDRSDRPPTGDQGNSV